MDVGDANNYLAEAVKVADLESFLVFGGEPMLYPARATAIFKKAQEMNIPRAPVREPCVQRNSHLQCGDWAHC
jgi:hypothetical protein